MFDIFKKKTGPIFIKDDSSLMRDLSDLKKFSTNLDDPQLLKQVEKDMMLI